MSEPMVPMSAEWWDSRKKILSGIASTSRKRGVAWTEAELERSRNATLASLGDEQGTIDYERNGLTREQWLAKWFPAAVGGVEVSPRERLIALRNSMRGL